MKKIVFLVCIIIANAGFLLSQTNHSLYALDDIFPVCISKNDNIIYGVKWEDNQKVIKKIQLADGKELQTFTKGLPENPIGIMYAHPKKSVLYFVTARKLDDKGVSYADAVYKMDTKSGNIKLLRKVHYNYLIPNKMGMVGNLLVFTTLRNPTYVFDTKRNQFRNLNPNVFYQMISIAPSHNGFLMMNVNELEDGNIAVHFMNDENEMSDVIGYINRKLKIQTEAKNFQLSKITLVDSSYSWIGKDIRYNCFPIYNFEIVMRPFWLKNGVLLDKANQVSGIVDANNEYLIAKAGRKLLVYNYHSPNAGSTPILSEVDIENIKSYFNQTGSFDQVLISSEAVDAVFNAVFYEVYKSNRLKYIAAQFQGNYFELNDYSMLLSMVEPDFRLDGEASAKLFQEALNVLFPVNEFNKSFVNFDNEPNVWRFVRGEAFNNKYGIVVKTSAGKIQEIEYKTELFK